MTIPEHSMVVLTRDVPEEGLQAGKSGTVVGVYGNGGYEVEFFDLAGETIAVVILGEDDIRPLSDFPSCGNLLGLCEGWPEDRPVWIQSRGGRLERLVVAQQRRGGDGEPALVLRSFLWNELDAQTVDTRGWVLEWAAPPGGTIPATTLHRSEAGARARIAAVAEQLGGDPVAAAAAERLMAGATTGRVGDVAYRLRALELTD